MFVVLGDLAARTTASLVLAAELRVSSARAPAAGPVGRPRTCSSSSAIAADLSSARDNSPAVGPVGRPGGVAGATKVEEQTNDSDGRPTAFGMFGTGFLTSHLLSERVVVEGVAVGMDFAPKKFASSGKSVGRIAVS